MLKGMQQLQDLGTRVEANRIKAAASVPPAVDLEATGKVTDARRKETKLTSGQPRHLRGKRGQQKIK